MLAWQRTLSFNRAGEWDMQTRKKFNWQISHCVLTNVPGHLIKTNRVSASQTAINWATVHMLTLISVVSRSPLPRLDQALNRDRLR